MRSGLENLGTGGIRNSAYAVFFAAALCCVASSSPAFANVPDQIIAIGSGATNSAYASYNPGTSTRTMPGVVGNGADGGFLGGDFNGDGPEDLVCIDIDGTSNPFAFLTSSPGAQASTPAKWNNSLRGAAELTFYFLAGDYNGDGKQDVASLYLQAVDGNPNVMAKISLGPDGVVQTSGVSNWSLPAERNSAFISGKFLGSDSVDDIAAIASVSATQYTSRFYQGPTGSYSVANDWTLNISIGLVPVSFRNGDFNGDGIHDIAHFFRQTSTGQYSAIVQLGPNGAITQTWSLGSNPYSSFLVKDFNGDGRADIAAITVNGTTRIAEITLGSATATPAGTVTWTLTNVNGVVVGFVAGKFSQSAISGTILKEDNIGLGGVNVDAGFLGQVASATDGTFEIPNVYDGTDYTVIPTVGAFPGFRFNPTQRSGIVDGPTTANFTALENFDTDGDGILDHIDDDDDNDGLTDDEEAALGTNPLLWDTDGDGVSDGQEVSDGSDPLDRGSNSPPLETTVCSEWNGFLGGMWNVKEHVNLSSQTLNIVTKLYDAEGTERGNQSFFLPPGRELDLLVHEMDGWSLNSYGRVCSVVTNGNPGDVDGRMVYYKVENEFANPDINRFEFAFALPFVNGKTGSQFVPYNTYQPSLAMADQSNLAANWIQVTNLSDATAGGFLYFYGQDGGLLGTRRVDLLDGARRDVAAHEFGPSLVGVTEWRPDIATSKFLLRNARYLYNNPQGFDSFTTAFQFEGTVGNGRQIAMPVDTRAASSILEIANTTASPVTSLVSISNSAGVVISQQTVILPPFATHHIIVDEVLAGSEGLAVVEADTSASIIATVMQYGRTSNGGVRYIYGVQAKEALGTTLRGSYHTYLNQGCKLLLGNPSQSSVTANITITRSDGIVIASGSQVNVPARGMRSFDVCGLDSPESFGIVTVQPSVPNSITAVVVREGILDDYRFPTPMR